MFQWCTFRKGDRSCEVVYRYEKKYNYNVTMGQCEDFAGRVEFKVSSFSAMLCLVRKRIFWAISFFVPYYADVCQNTPRA